MNHNYSRTFIRYCFRFSAFFLLLIFLILIVSILDYFHLSNAKYDEGISNIFAIILFRYYLPYGPYIILFFVFLGLVLVKLKRNPKWFVIMCIVPLIVFIALFIGALKI